MKIESISNWSCPLPLRLRRVKFRIWMKTCSFRKHIYIWIKWLLWLNEFVKHKPRVAEIARKFKSRSTKDVHKYICYMHIVPILGITRRNHLSYNNNWNFSLDFGKLKFHYLLIVMLSGQSNHRYLWWSTLSSNFTGQRIFVALPRILIC